MTHAAMQAQAPAGAALLIGELGQVARLTRGFDQAVVCDPAEAAAALEAGDRFDTVVVAGGADAGLVRAAVAATTARTEPALLVLDARAVETLATDDELVVEGWGGAAVALVGGVPCLTLNRGGGARVAQVGLVVAALDAADREPDLSRHVVLGERASLLEQQLDELQEELLTSQAALALASAEQTELESRAMRLEQSPLGRVALAWEGFRRKGLSALRSSRKARRLVLAGGAALVLLVLVAAFSALVAWLAGAGRAGALAVAGTLLVLATQVVMVRAQRQTSRTLGTVAKQTKRSATEAGKANDQTREALRLQATRWDGLERKVGVLTATAVDTAHAVRELADRDR